MAPTVCGGCGVVTYEGEPPCECPPNVVRVPLTATEAAKLSVARWQAVSLERIADALEELCTWKEKEARAALGMKEH
jgi:hypothetical protein